jgi:hypothetical protein
MPAMNSAKLERSVRDVYMRYQGIVIRTYLLSMADMKAK